MNFFWFVLLIIGALILVALIQIIKIRKYVPDEYAWLQVLSTSRWLNVNEICLSMQQLVEQELVLEAVAITDLGKLQKLGLVETNVRIKSLPGGRVIPESVYRMTQNGLRRRNEQKSNVSSVRMGAFAPT